MIWKIKVSAGWEIQADQVHDWTRDTGRVILYWPAKYPLGICNHHSAELLVPWELHDPDLHQTKDVTVRSPRTRGHGASSGKACTFRACHMLPSPFTWERGLASNDGIPRKLPIRTIILWQHEVLCGCSSEASLAPEL